MKKLVSILLVLTLALALFATAAAEGDGEQIVLKLSCAASEQEKVSCEQVVKRFEEKHPNVKVEAEYYAGLSWDEIIQKQLVQFAAHEQADVVYIAIEGTHLMVEYGLFQPITDLIEANQDYFSNVPQSAFEAFRVGDELYEVPFNCNDMMIAYNTKMFEEIGYKPGRWTTDEFLEALGKIDAKYNTPDTPVTEKVWGTIVGENPYLWMAAFGTSVLNEDWTASNMKDPAVREVLQFLYDLVHKYGYAPVREANTDDTALFCSGRTATIFTGPFVLSSLKANNMNDFNMAIAPRGTENGRSAYGVGGLGMMAGCEHREEAFELMKEFCSREMAEIQARELTSLPLIEEVATSETWLSHCENMNLFYDELKDAIKLPSPVCYAELNVIMKDMMNNIMTETLTIDEAIEQADAAITEAFAEFE